MNQHESLAELYQEGIYNVREKTLVIIPVPWKELSPDSIQLLNKILLAVKLSLSAVGIVTLTKLNEDFIQTNRPSRILIFGVPSNPPIQPYSNSDYLGIPAIATDALDSFDDSKKKTLWLALKEMFTV